MSNSTTWPTAVTEIEPNRVAVRGYDIAELMGNISFGQATYLILRGEMPSAEIGRLMEAIIVSSIDHGVMPPSAIAARTVASSGANLCQAVAAGILTINRWHGGAIENCAVQLGHIIDRAKEENTTLDAAAATEVAALRDRGERMSGFGHRVHTNDPRTVRLFELSAEAGIEGEHFDAARAVERSFAAVGKKLPINVDGAIAVVLAQLGFEPAVMNGLFMIARVPGLVAQVHEEQTRMKPMRKFNPADHTYDGPDVRSLP